MNLLHVTPTYLPALRYGGPIHSVHGLCRALAVRGHRVDVLTTSVDGPSDSDVPHGLPVQLDGVHVWYHHSRVLRRLYASPSLAATLWRRLPQTDVLHSHAVFLLPGLAAVRMAALRAVPSVITPRGMLVGDLIERKSRLVKRAWLRLFERGNLSRAAAIHFTSRREQEDFAALDLPARRQWIVPNGMDLTACPQAPAQQSGEILFIGRINWKKGIERLIRALPAVPTARLTIAGNDEENYTPTLQALAAECGVTHRLRFVGYADAAKKSALLREATLLVLPSHSENFGNVVLEAWAAARAVLVTPEVGLADAVRTCGGGVVSEGEPAALGAAMRSLLDAPKSCQAMGLRGWQHAQARYSWPAIAADMEAHYQELLSHQSKAR